MSFNLDLVKSIYAGWAKGDFGTADWADPEIDFQIRGGLSPGTWKGVPEMAEAWATSLRAYEDLRAIPDEFRELDDGRVLVFLRNQGRGRGSGIDIGEITAKSANVFTVREGKVTSLVLYWDREEAIAELGLREKRETGNA